MRRWFHIVVFSLSSSVPHLSFFWWLERLGFVIVARPRYLYSHILSVCFYCMSIPFRKRVYSIRQNLLPEGHTILPELSPLRDIISLNSFGAKFQTTFVVCFSFLTKYRLKRSLYVKLKDWMSNSVDPDETAHMSRLIWINAVCKRILLSPVAVKELKKCISELNYFLSFMY